MHLCCNSCMIKEGCSYIRATKKSVVEVSVFQNLSTVCCIRYRKQLHIQMVLFLPKS